jgi:hypothetical protein
MAELTKIDTVSLDNLGGGAAVEKFNDELAEVLRNIQDPNTSSTAVREIKLTVSLKPAEDRASAGVTIATTKKLAPIKAFASQVFIGRGAAGIEAREVIQNDLFPGVPAANVYQMDHNKAMEEGK